MENVGNTAAGNRQAANELLGLNIAARRKQRGISQRKMADLINTQQATLNKIELGQRLPTRDQARAIARFFDYELTELHLTLPELYPAPAAPEVTEGADTDQSEAA